MVAHQGAGVNTDLEIIDALLDRLHTAWMHEPDGAQRDQICARAAEAQHERLVVLARSGNHAAQQFFELFYKAEKAREVRHG